MTIAESTFGSGQKTLYITNLTPQNNANTLGNGWSQLVTLGNAGIRVNGNQAFCVNSGLAAALCINGIGANAYRTSPTYGNSQAAMFTFVITLSGVTVAKIGSPFWGAVAGVVAMAISSSRFGPRRSPAPAPAPAPARAPDPVPEAGAEVRRP